MVLEEWSRIAEEAANTEPETEEPEDEEPKESEEPEAESTEDEELETEDWETEEVDGGGAILMPAVDGSGYENAGLEWVGSEASGHMTGVVAPEMAAVGTSEMPMPEEAEGEEPVVVAEKTEQHYELPDAGGAVGKSCHYWLWWLLLLPLVLALVARRVILKRK
jgi:hypothetical protein